MGGFSTPSAAGGVDTRTATLVVAASDSLHPEKADYQCDGINDHMEIQAALDALPATGGEVKLLDGTYNCEVAAGRNISNVTVKGNGKNTILTTSTPNLAFLSFVGASGAELTGIIIADLQIDGGASLISDCGIYFEYVDYSFIQNVYSRRHASGSGSYQAGIYLLNSDFNSIIGNICQGNGYEGIWLYASSNNTIIGNICQGNSYDGICFTNSSSNNIISGNICQGNTGEGIFLSSSSNNTISGNTCQGNEDGIDLNASSNNNAISGNTCQGNAFDGIDLNASSNNTVSGNTCQGNGYEGISLSALSNSNTIVGNTCIANSQSTNNTLDNIRLVSSDYNLIVGNVCRQGALTNKPKYGINIANDACDRSCLVGNDLYDSGATGDLNDVPTTNPTLKHDNRNLAGTGWLAEV